MTAHTITKRLTQRSQPADTPTFLHWKKVLIIAWEKQRCCRSLVMLNIFLRAMCFKVDSLKDLTKADLEVKIRLIYIGDQS
jgi:hypothetical protein